MRRFPLLAFTLGLLACFSPTPSAEEVVLETDDQKVLYGSVFDSTRDKDPAQFSVGGVIPCFSEGLQKLKVGGKAKLTCPAEIAYGDRGRPGSIRPGAALTFEIELVEVIGKPATPESSPVP